MYSLTPSHDNFFLLMVITQEKYRTNTFVLNSRDCFCIYLCIDKHFADFADFEKKCVYWEMDPLC